MRIGNNSIPGLYKFKAFTLFEKDDIIYYNGMLYVVNAGTYEGDLTPDESPKCDSFIEILRESNDLVTSSNIMTIVNSIIKGVQLGGSITRIKINDITQLDEYIHTGIYSLDSNHIIQNKAFDSIFRVYRFEKRENAEYVTKVVQEIINYAPTTDLGEYDTSDYFPTNIWYRVGTLDENEVPTWSEFRPIVSAADNTEYGNVLQGICDYDHQLSENIIELSNLIELCAYYFIDEDSNTYSIPITHSGLINVIYKYNQGGNPYQDNFTVDVSDGEGSSYLINVTTLAGIDIIVNVTKSDEYYIVSFYKDSAILSNVLKVIEITV